MLATASPIPQVQSKQQRYKSASDVVLLGRAKKNSPAIDVQLKDGSARDFIFSLANNK